MGDLVILNHHQMIRTTLELAPFLQASEPHQEEGVWATAYDFVCNRPHDGSSLEWGFEPVALRPRDHTTRPSRSLEKSGSL
ncbi:hypothetical protein AVEN_160945-1 [Araneus ventricosus]|uniref:Uncharacterized protein n=1 Tax=Araneus ventricosus TaxID=182803 RepID=A0A4Y2KYN1_ARAVE|nr:hypothetical protein AVEN_160945-1 [Araneus ventricosus]